MLLLGVIIFSIAIPLYSNTVNAFHYARLAVIIFIMSGLLTIEVINIGVEGINIYCNLVFQSNRTLFIEVVLFMVGGVCLITMPKLNKNASLSTLEYTFEEGAKGVVRREGKVWTIPKEYSLVVLLSVIGASIIVSSNNMISIYLATELQSFGLYIIAALWKDSLRSVQASLKYFILGAWSSAFILLGAGMIYTCTGSTSLANMSHWISSTSTEPWSYGLMFIYCGYLFKVSAAPFHNWAPDVYQNTPTVVTIMLITIPKISIITALYTLTKEFITTKMIFVLLVVAITSIIIGTVTGLVQTRLRRLMAFSTISHVGFIVLCLSLGTESSNNALIFYIVQYSISTILIWMCIIAYEAGGRVDYISDMRQSFSRYSMITLSIVISLFSISGLPPIVGFVAKINVLWSSVEEGAYVIFIIAIISSVISASYYLKIIKIIMFDESSNQNNETSNISPLHAFSIATCTAFLSLFILDSELLINSIELATFTI